MMCRLAEFTYDELDSLWICPTGLCCPHVLGLSFHYLSDILHNVFTVRGVSLLTDSLPLPFSIPIHVCMYQTASWSFLSLLAPFGGAESFCILMGVVVPPLEALHNILSIFFGILSFSNTHFSSNRSNPGEKCCSNHIYISAGWAWS